MSRGSIREYVEAIRERYSKGGQKEKGEILEEFTQVTGYHRKAVIRLLKREHGPPAGRRGRPRRYELMDVKYVPPELSGLPYTRYKVGFILTKVDEGGSLIALYHATQTLPFPVCYVQTDNGLEFQKRFLDTYNTTRPHMGINMLTPKEAINLYHML
ncbi:MAG: hypothetical protein ABID84_01900 [Chloroflexota bacterium]